MPCRISESCGVKLVSYSAAFSTFGAVTVITTRGFPESCWWMDLQSGARIGDAPQSDRARKPAIIQHFCCSLPKARQAGGIALRRLGFPQEFPGSEDPFRIRLAGAACLPNVTSARMTMRQRVLIAPLHSTPTARKRPYLRASHTRVTALTFYSHFCDTPARTMSATLLQTWWCVCGSPGLRADSDHMQDTTAPPHDLQDGTVS